MRDTASHTLESKEMRSPMPLLPRRFERLKSVLNHRMADLTVLLEHVE